MSFGKWTPSALQLLNERMGSHALSQAENCVPHAPIHLRLQVASACNLDCYMCSEHNRPVGERHGTGLISISCDLVDRIATEIFPLSSRLSIGVGGEPMLADTFLYVLDRAYACNQEVHIMTNGTLMHLDSAAEDMARCVTHLNVSLDAATEETYERIRHGGRWQRVRKNLDLFNAYRLAQPQGQRTELTLHFVLMRSNVHELPLFVELAHSLEATAIHGHHVIPVTTEGQAEVLLLEPDLYNRYWAEAHARADALGVRLDIPQPFTAPTASSYIDSQDQLEPVGSQRELRRPELASHSIPCASPTLDTYVFYDGRVFPCCHPHAHAKMQVGDLRVQSFEEIWNGPLYRNLRAGLRTGDAPRICKTCSVVHDPPPEIEDPAALLAGPELEQFYARRELEPPTASGPAALLRWVDSYRGTKEVELALTEIEHVCTVTAQSNPLPPPALE